MSVTIETWAGPLLHAGGNRDPLPVPVVLAANTVQFIPTPNFTTAHTLPAEGAQFITTITSEVDLDVYIGPAPVNPDRYARVLSGTSRAFGALPGWIVSVRERD